MKQKIYFILIFILATLSSKAQIGGEYTYQFLELTNSARMAALGGTQIAILDTKDLNTPYCNPSMLHEDMDNHVLVNYVNYLTDINYGYASYAKTYRGIGNFAIGVHYINYGKFDEATEEGDLTGSTFKAAEYALNLMYSNNYERLHYGINVKPIFSSLESYNSLGIAVDVGANFTSKGGRTTVALVARNIGTQITTYYDGAEHEEIPFNLQIGISQRLEHAPLTFVATMQNLNTWDLSSSDDDDDDEISAENIHDREESLLKQTMRHFVFGVELAPVKNFTVRVGYNYQRRQELQFDDKASMVGFSAGFGLQIKRFRIDYGIAQYHLAGSSNLFSVAINLNDRY